MENEGELKNVLTRGAAIDFAAWLSRPPSTPLETGITPWDNACVETSGKGLSDWWYVVLGGASNSGKTQLMMYLAKQAVECGIATGIISMEVPMTGMQRQIYSRITEFGYYSFDWETWNSQIVKEKPKRLVDQVELYAKEDKYAEYERTLYVHEFELPPSLTDIIRVAHQMHEMGARCIFLDHLQLIKSPADQIADRATEVSEALRRFAHKSPCLVVALSQLNRMAARDRTKPATMHDLWGGTAIEANANQVILLDHTVHLRPKKHILRTFLTLDKNREGPNKVRIPVELDFKSGRWRVAQPDELHLWEKK